MGEKPTPHFDYYLRLLPFLALTWPVVFYFRGLYEPRRGRSRIEEALSILLATAFATVLITGLSSLYRPPEPLDPNLAFTYSRGFLAVFAILSYLYVATGRLAIRETMRALRRRGHNLARILIIGTGRLGREVTQKILDHRELGFEVVGFLDDKKPSGDVLGRPILGTVKDLAEVLEAHPVEQVLIALPLEAKRKTMQILELLAKEVVEVRLVPDVLEYTALNASLEDLDGTPLINLSRTPLEGWNSFAKRVIDIALSAPLLDRALARHRRHRDRDLARGPRPRLLPSGAHGDRRQVVPHPQVQIDAPRRRGIDRTDLGDPQRSAAHAHRRAACAAPRSTSCLSSGTCCAATCRWSARAPSAPPSSRSSSTRCRSTCSAIASSPASPAGRRCTAGAATPRFASASSTTSTTSRTGRCAWTSRSCG